MIHLVWRIRPDGLFETQWIRELLAKGGIEHDEVFDFEGTYIQPRSIVVFNHCVDYEAYFQKYEDAGIKYGAIHLSDETLGDTTNFYGHKNCIFVYRNYHHPIVSAKYPHVVTFGLGYKSGFTKVDNIPTGPTRYYTWSFAGNIHTPERMACVKPMLSMVPHRIHTTSGGFNAIGGLPTEEYRALMDDSKFVMCPIGQGNVDSFRVYEALEAGAIPVVIAETPMQPYKPSYWHVIFPWMQAKVIPMIIHRNWEEAAKTMRDIVQNKEAYEQLQKHVVDFWENAKKIWGTTLAAYSLMLPSATMHEDLE